MLLREELWYIIKALDRSNVKYNVIVKEKSLNVEVSMKVWDNYQTLQRLLDRINVPYEYLKRRGEVRGITLSSESIKIFYATITRLIKEYGIDVPLNKKVHLIYEAAMMVNNETLSRENKQKRFDELKRIKNLLKISNL